MNPAVTLADASQGGLPWLQVSSYIVVQIAGAFAGVAVAHLMFGQPLFFASHHARAGAAQLLAEFIAAFGLLSVICACVRLRPAAVAPAVAYYIAAAYWFTSSTSFANPAVRQARAASDTFAGIRPADVPGFVAAQLAGAATGTGFFRWLVPASEKQATERPAASAEEHMRRLLPTFPQPTLQPHSKEHPVWTRFESFWLAVFSALEKRPCWASWLDTTVRPASVWR